VEREVVALKERREQQTDVEKFVVYEVNKKHAIRKRDSWQDTAATRRQERRQDSDQRAVTVGHLVGTVPKAARSEGRSGPGRRSLRHPAVTLQFSTYRVTVLR
jgi:hypothetical protein